MGRILIIKGADFSRNSIENIEIEVPDVPVAGTSKVYLQSTSWNKGYINLEGKSVNAGSNNYSVFIPVSVGDIVKLNSVSYNDTNAISFYTEENESSYVEGTKGLSVPNVSDTINQEHVYNVTQNGFVRLSRFYGKNIEPELTGDIKLYEEYSDGYVNLSGVFTQFINNKSTAFIPLKKGQKAIIKQAVVFNDAFAISFYTKENESTFVNGSRGVSTTKVVSDYEYTAPADGFVRFSFNVGSLGELAVGYFCIR